MFTAFTLWPINTNDNPIFSTENALLVDGQNSSRVIMMLARHKTQTGSTPETTTTTVEYN